MEGKKKVFFKYSEEDLRSAVMEIREKNGKIRETARKYSIPHSTLLNKLKGRTPEVRKMGPSTILTPAEEQLLCNWMIANAKKGFPLNKRMLVETVQEIIIADGRCNPFHENKPGNTWFKAFLKRHAQIAQRHAESIDSARAVVNEASIRKWHNALESYLKSENALEILNDPQRIFNADESGFLTNPLSGLVLAPKGMGNLYAINTGREKESITVLVTINAAGELYPPMIVYPHERIPAAIVQNLNKDWPVGRSPTGWMTGQAFYGYIANTFLPHLKNHGIKLPILFLIDGHKSHLTYTTSKFCAENDILLYSLLPNATHLLQPADVSVFRPLKVNWKSTVEDWKKKTGNRNVTRILFGPLFESCLNSIASDTIKNGFRKCGIFPFDANAIDYTKCMTDKSRTYESTEKIQVKPTTFNVEHLLYLESLMPSGRAEDFRTSEKTGWKGPDSAKELYDVWLKLRKRLVPDTQNSLINKAGNSTNEVEAGQQDQDMAYVKQTATSIENEVPDEVKSDARAQDVIVDTALQNGNFNDTAVQNEVISPINKLCVSPAFLNHVIWPTESLRKSTRRRRERLPHAASSKAWLNYWESKEEDKQKKEESKKRKQEIRQAKQFKKAKKSSEKAAIKASTSKESLINDWVCKACKESWMEEDMMGIKETWVKCDTCNDPYHIKCVSKRHRQQFALDDIQSDEEVDFVCISCFGETDED